MAGNLLCSPDTSFPRCAAILVYCSVRDWTRFLRHRIRKYADSPVHTLSDSLQIYFFPLWGAELFFSGFAVKFARCVWTVAVSGKKKLQIRKYPDTCGRGLNHTILHHCFITPLLNNKTSSAHSSTISASDLLSDNSLIEFKRSFDCSLP